MTEILGMSASMKSTLLLLLPLAGSVLLAFGVFQVVMDLRKTNQKRMIDRLKERSGTGDRKKTDKDIKSQVLRRRARQAEPIGIDKIIGKLSFVPKLQRMLDQANIDWSASRMLMNLVAAAAGVLCLLLLVHVGPITSMGVALLVVFLPLMYVLVRRRKRMSKLLMQLPDVFELISQALRAGHSLASGIHLVSQQMPDPVGTEFGRVFHEQNLGIKLEEAMTNMADRVDMLDVRFFVTAVLVQRQTGGDLVEILNNIGAVIRDRISLFGQVRALTAEGRLSGAVLLALPIIVFFAELQLNPDYASVLLYDPKGRIMLVAASVMMLLGWAMIRKIVNIKV